MIGILGSGIAISAGAVGVFALNDANVFHLHEDELREYEAKFYVEDQLTYRTGLLKKGTEFKYEPNTPVKPRTPDGKVYTFIGWDLLGNGLPDVLPGRIYSDVNAKAVFMRLPAIEKLLMDPDLIAKIGEILKDLDVELTPEQIQKILEWLMNLGIDWENIDISVLEQLIDVLGIDLNDFMDMSGLDLDDVMKILNRPMFRYTPSAAGGYYFRSQSYGNVYKDNEWAKADYYPSWLISSGSTNPLNYVTDKIVQTNRIPQVHFDMTYLNPGEAYPVPTNEIGNTQNLESDSISLTNPTEIQPIEDFKYSAAYSTNGLQFVPACTYVVNLLKVMPFSNSAITNDELKYRQYAKEHYLQVDEKYRSLFSSIASENGITKDESYNYISQILEFFSKNYHLDYKMKSYPSGVDKILYFMNEAKVGIGTHFADATTMFFRTLGVPARTVSGYVDYAEAAQAEREVGGMQSHYWTEIYLDGMGWLSFDACLGDNVVPPEYSQYLFNSFETIDPELGKDKITDLKVSATKEYFTGDSFDVGDLKFEATFENGNTRTLEPSEITYISPISTATPGEKTVTAIVVKGTEVSVATTTIDVKPVEPVDLDINPTDYQAKYFTGTDFNGVNGGTVTMSNGKTEYTAVNYTTPDMSTPGVKDVLCSVPGYPGINQKIQINVIDEPDTPLDNIYVSNSYQTISPNQDFDLDNFEIYATYDDGLTRQVDSSNGNLYLGEHDFSKPGEQDVQLYYEEGDKTSSYPVHFTIKNRGFINIDSYSYYNYGTYDSTNKEYDGSNFDLESIFMLDPSMTSDGQHLVINKIYVPEGANSSSSPGVPFDAVFTIQIWAEINGVDTNITSEYAETSDLEFYVDGAEKQKTTEYAYVPSLEAFKFKHRFEISKRQLTVHTNDIYASSKADAINQRDYWTENMLDGNYIDPSSVSWVDPADNIASVDNELDYKTLIIRNIFGEDVTSFYDIILDAGTIYYEIT